MSKPRRFQHVLNVLSYFFRVPILAFIMIVTAASGAAPSQKIDIRTVSLPALSSTGGGFAAKTSTALLAAATTGSVQPDGSLSIWYSPLPKDPEGKGIWTESTIKVPRWTASTQWQGEVVVAGGLLAGMPVSKVRLIGTNESGEPFSRELPDLPAPVAGAGAAIIGSTCYVFGGISSVNPMTLTNAFWKLDLAKQGQEVWANAGTFPGQPRTLSAVTGQHGVICIFGGINGEGHALREAWMYRPQPVEGTSEVGWKRAADIPQAFAGASALPLGQTGVILMGGIRNGTEGAGLPFEIKHTGVDGHPWFYHAVTDSWCPFDRDVPSGLVLKMDSDIWLIGNERTLAISFPRTIRNLAPVDYIVIVAYFALLAGIGFYFAKQESSEEFSLGNREVKWWAAGISMFATGASAISFMAIPALAFSTNLVWTFSLITLIPAYFITAHLIYPLLRRMEITSTYEYLERRFNRPLRLIASAQCIVIQTIGRTSVVLVLPALAISSVTGFSVFWCVVLMGVLTTIYTSVGGFESVIWTEVFQGILKFIAPLAMIVVAISSLPGGFGEFWQTSESHGKFEFALMTWDATVPAVWILVISSMLSFTITKAGDQPIIQRVFSTPLRDVRRVSAMEVACSILIGLLVNFLGISIFSYFRAHPEQYAPNAQIDQVVPLFVTQAMPPGFAGVVIAAIFASAMATVASAMNSVATIYTEDFYPLIKPQATDKERLRTLKATSYLVGAVGTGMALLLAATNPQSLMVVWSQIVSLLGGGVVGVYSLGMFTTRVNGFGAVCGAIASIIVTLLIKLYTPLHWSTYMPIAILSCMLAGYVFSIFSKQTKNLDGLTVYTPKRPPNSPH